MKPTACFRFRTFPKTLLKAVLAHLYLWRNRRFGQVHCDYQPLARTAIFSAEQMEQHGKELAQSHTLSTSRTPDHLLKRLDNNEQVLIATCNLLTIAVKARLRIAPAGEWLLDNFYLVEEQISTARQHLPKGYSRELPRLAKSASGVSAGLPRVYDIALEVISHGDGRIDDELLCRFVAAYQTVTPLTLGELWAIPIMLRLALIENLHCVAARINTVRMHWEQAQAWTGQMMAIVESDPKNLILVIADMARSSPPMSGAFVAELARRLQGHGAALALPLSWIEQWLAEASLTTEQMVRAENQQQAADQVSISNSIGSLRFLGAMDWRDFVESMSLVEQVLRQDAGGIYPAMDFLTRDRYRHVIDRLAKHSTLSEIGIAQQAMDMAAQAVTGRDVAGTGIGNGIERINPASHVGYYLIDKGLPELEQAVKARFPLRRAIDSLFFRNPLVTYLGSILLVTVLFMVPVSGMAYGQSIHGWRLLLLGILSLMAAMQLASALVNWLATLMVTPQRLPRMDYAQGLPEAMRTLVVIPTLLCHAKKIDDLLEALEVRFLGNRDEYLYFGLLTDFGDEQDETLDVDDGLLQRMKTGIENLNKKYSNGHQGDDSQDCSAVPDDHFFLFHRARCWNPVAKKWMGYERKRGKLADLNALLRGDDVKSGADTARFSAVVGNIAALAHVKYVITLDTDTQLPRDSAHQLVAVMAHPLNHPRYDEKTHCINGGYGILQPRMATSLAAANRSRYVQLCGSEAGVDPYTRAVSDVYQDVFGEGSFIGKGIYDVDAFEYALKGRLPENRILSHDLLEGCYARSGLISDVQLYDDCPLRYDTDASRQERWIRGDWQIAQWLLPRVPDAQEHHGQKHQGQKQYRRNPLSALSRWKIFDNLRRSVMTIVLTLLFIAGWSFTSHPGLWTLAVISVMLIPIILINMVTALRKPVEENIGQHLRRTLASAGRSLLQAGFRVACLPYEAGFSLIAIVRSVWRLFFSRGRLLDWKASDVNHDHAHHTDTVPGLMNRDLMTAYRTMYIAPLLAATTTIVLVLLHRDVLVAAPVLLLWLLMPGIAWWLSKPLLRREALLSKTQQDFLRKAARKTWAFFDRFVVAEDNWLPPDNFQEQPGPVLAHRTSPTNIGMALLANLSACDFAYISAGTLLERTGNTFAGMALLERHRGHFYNWYDTQSLQPLLPRYISSVDSGNLAGHLLTLRIGLLDIPSQKIVHPRLVPGLLDTLIVIVDTLDSARPSALQAWVDELQILLNDAMEKPPSTLLTLFQCLNRIAGLAALMTSSTDIVSGTEAEYWIKALEIQCLDMLHDMVFLAPWLTLPVAPQGMGQFLELVDIPVLRELADHADQLLAEIDMRGQQELTTEQEDWLGQLLPVMTLGRQRVLERIAASERLAQQANAYATIEYDFLYDKSRQLLAVGYNVDELRRDACFYDLLASEARLTTFVAIAQGQLPQESWFALGRLLTSSAGSPILVSWSGSMFEYLMPLLVMPSYEGTLLDQTCRAAVARQMAYGKQRGLPWGVSESGYSTVDASLNYQYHAFGVPGLGLKRGLAEDSVVSPYASALALMVEPEAACANLQRLAETGLEGQFGFYEAIDYTPVRMTRNQSSMVVRSFMAHHQGMTLLSLSHLLLARPMQKRFVSDPVFQATLLLLQEKIPKTSIIVHAHVAEHSQGSAFFDQSAIVVNAPMAAQTLTPKVQLLSNDRYHVMLTNAGGGYSRWNDLAVTRWREDSTCDNWGTFIYLRDHATAKFWSATHQPTLKQADSYEAIFSEGRAEYRRRDHDYETYSEIVVSPEDDIELRRVRITNRAKTHRKIEVTSYTEIVLAAQAADMIQPAFGNLFVQTEIIASRHAIIATRRPRSADEKTPWMFHLLSPNGTAIGEVSYETDRMRFIGRGQSIVAPQVMTTPQMMAGSETLSGSQGSVLDPIAAIRCVVELEAEQSATIDMISGIASSREECLALVEKYQDRHFADRVLDIAGTHSSVALRQTNTDAADAQIYRRLAGSVIYASAALRAEAGMLIQNRRGQSGLWGYAISGDLPIMLLKITDIAHIELARQVINCHAYWRLKGLMVDLVIWNEDHAGYRQQVQDQIMGLIVSGSEAHALDKPGGIFVRSAEQISQGDRILLQAVARIIIDDSRGTLAEQVDRRALVNKPVERLVPGKKYRPDPVAEKVLSQELILANPLGGFSADGREYVITTSAAQMTPLPWVNVLANAHFGTVISESGMAYTWCENAHEFRLTPWSNDQVGASGGEAYYLRDEETGHVWSPTPLPRRGTGEYVTRHGFGYSIFEHEENGIVSELSVYVDIEESIKFSVLKIRNVSGRARQVSATGYVEWVLGDLRSKSAMHVVTDIDASSGALFARNCYNIEFTGKVAFFDVDDVSRTLTGDRSEFLGRNGSLQHPDALTRARLSGRVGAGLDPCGAIQVAFDLADGQEREIIFRLGSGRDLAHARDLASRLRIPGTARNALAVVKAYWQQTLGAVQVETPDMAVNVLANGWLVYQTLACRIWARSGFYQSGGAFGFRDQLQDMMALVHARPDLLREHLLQCAGHQYPEGDVQHWWHPPAGRGVRTRCSDDYLWLPYAACRYVKATADNNVLDEDVHFLDGRLLAEGEESYYDLPGRSAEKASLYAHCVRAIERALHFGERGLPLMGSGDWNDGMNLVGIHGKGESVWLGFFLFDVLGSFAGLARQYNDEVFAVRCEQAAVQLQANIEQHAWDGRWYRRAWFDDGSLLGSAVNSECAIDSIAQSWSVISGAGNSERSLLAMASLDSHLVRRSDGLIQLLDPPFNSSVMNPGYIRGYVPGVRENGGQYTQAAVWAAMAFAQLGDSARAWELLGMINPVHHGDSVKSVDVYKAEPYVLAADVYAIAPHVGRGGWTWYTGSAGWLYRLIIESLLGLKLEDNRLVLTPCIPQDWQTWVISYRCRETTYRLQFRQGQAATASIAISVDGIAQEGNSITLIDDLKTHQVEVSIQRVHALSP